MRKHALDILLGLLCSGLLIAVFAILVHHRLISSLRLSPITFLIQDRDYLKGKAITADLLKEICFKSAPDLTKIGYRIRALNETHFLVVQPAGSRGWFEASPETIYLLDCDNLTILTVSDELNLIAYKKNSLDVDESL